MYRATAIIVLFVILLIGMKGDVESNVKNRKDVIYVGTFDGRGSQGLYVLEFDRSTAKLSEIQTVSDREAPNFQALHPSGAYLYSVSGEAFSEDTDHGTVTAYRIDPETGKLKRINKQSVEGDGPAHVSIDPQGRFAYVSNYSSGNLSVFSINADGSLTEAVDVVQHEGSSINERRQSMPHVHSVIPSDDGRFIYASDLGIDKIMIYAVDRNSGKLTPAEPAYAESTPGAGPRHFTLHPSGNFAYSAEELSSTVVGYRVDKSTGKLTPIQRVSMMPEGFEETNSAADIHISPDGKFLYASNRGHDSLVIYAIEESSGELSLVGHESTRGGHPRNFMIDQQGEFVLVANRDDDNVVVFRRDEQTGELNYTGKEANIPMAVCVTQLLSD